MLSRAVAMFICLFAVWIGSASAAEVLACEMQSAHRKGREFRCPLTAKGNEQPLRFKVDFSGSHDDTELSMTLTLDGAPVACSQNSKTWLNGEDGNVSLDCHLVLNGKIGEKQTLVAAVKIWHAELVAVELSTP